MKGLVTGMFIQMSILSSKISSAFALSWDVDYVLSKNDSEPRPLNTILRTKKDMEEFYNMQLDYQHSPMYESELRVAIAEMYNEQYQTSDGKSTWLNESDVLIASAEETIPLVMRALLSDGDEIVTLSPASSTINAAAKTMGVTIIAYNAWSMKQQYGRYHLNLNHAELEKAITARTRMILLQNPHPTGYTHSADEMRKIIDLCQKYKLIVVSCEGNGVFGADVMRPAVVEASSYGSYENVISISNTTAFGMAGVKIEWALTKNKTLMSLLRNKTDHHTGFSCSTADMLLFTLGIRDGNYKPYAKTVSTIVKANGKALGAFVDKNRDLFLKAHWSYDTGKITTLVAYRGHQKYNLPVQSFTDHVLAEGKIYLKPITFKCGRYTQWLQIGLAHNDMAEGIYALGEFVDEWRKQDFKTNDAES